MADTDTLYALMLNHIYSPTHRKTAVAYSNSIESLKKFVESEKVETYQERLPNPSMDGEMWTFFKIFRKGGPLEEYNSPDDKSFVEFPTLEKALKQEEEKYTAWLSRLHKIE